MKKIYSKPEAEEINFYTEEAVTGASGILELTDMELGWL